MIAFGGESRSECGTMKLRGTASVGIRGPSLRPSLSHLASAEPDKYHLFRVVYNAIDFFIVKENRWRIIKSSLNDFGVMMVPYRTLEFRNAPNGA